MNDASRPARKQIGQTGRYSRGVAWRPLSVREAVGKPLAQWAYITPRFPDGIKISDLKNETPDMQREIARCWFGYNLKPYDLSGKVYFAVGVHGVGLDQAPLAPGPLSAASVLDLEFNDVIPPQVITPLSNELGNRWMWIDDPIPELRDSSSVTVPELVDALDHLSELLSGLMPVYGGLGHNGPPEELPLTVDEHALAMHDIRSARAALASGNLDEAKSISSRVWKVARQIGFWAVVTIAAEALSDASKVTTDVALKYYGYSTYVQEIFSHYDPR